MTLRTVVRTFRLFQRPRRLLLAAALCWCGLVDQQGFAGEPAGRPLAPPTRQAKADGKELFTREWLPSDPRAHGGDGLGPVFNDSSCAGCHNQGGLGGAGAKSKNVSLVIPLEASRGGGFVLHRFGVHEQFAAWRAGQLAGNMGQRKVNPGGAVVDTFLQGNKRLVQRNTTALFGAGKIDAIDERVILAAAEQKFPDYPEITGRASRLEQGRVGRFGWKGQIADLNDFVLTACSVELGLHVPAKEQTSVPFDKNYKAPGLDMNNVECEALMRFVHDLPVPRRQKPSHEAAEKYLAEGEKLFAAVGCATCHVPKLGEVEGIYSDLLLHDMGQNLSDSPAGGVGFSYGGAPPSTPIQPKKPKIEEVAAKRRPVPEPASVSEWRTPPLWGVRDSAPYLHDGRADTLDEAIGLHAGEAERSRAKFAALKHEEKQKLLAFLHSLVAPEVK